MVNHRLTSPRYNHNVTTQQNFVFFHFSFHHKHLEQKYFCVFFFFNSIKVDILDKIRNKLCNSLMNNFVFRRFHYFFRLSHRIKQIIIQCSNIVPLFLSSFLSTPVRPINATDLSALSIIRNFFRDPKYSYIMISVCLSLVCRPAVSWKHIFISILVSPLFCHLISPVFAFNRLHYVRILRTLYSL